MEDRAALPRLTWTEPEMVSESAEANEDEPSKSVERRALMFI